MGLITTVRGYLDKTGLTRLFDGFKAKGVRMGALVMMLIVFSLSENNSMAACAEWLKDIRIRRLFGIKEQVSQRTLNRALQKLGSARAIEFLRKCCKNTRILGLKSKFKEVFAQCRRCV